MDKRRLESSMPTWTLAQERELLSVASELDEAWDSFASGDGPGIVPVSMCREWRDRILLAFDGSNASEGSKRVAKKISGNVRE